MRDRISQALVFIGWAVLFAAGTTLLVAWADGRAQIGQGAIGAFLVVLAGVQLRSQG